MILLIESNALGYILNLGHAGKLQQVRMLEKEKECYKRKYENGY